MCHKVAPEVSTIADAVSPLNIGRTVCVNESVAENVKVVLSMGMYCAFKMVGIKSKASNIFFIRKTFD